jgi:hypothetical protein
MVMRVRSKIGLLPAWVLTLFVGIAAIAFVAIVALGTVWLTERGSRGAELTTVWQFWVAVVGLVVSGISCVISFQALRAQKASAEAAGPNAQVLLTQLDEVTAAFRQLILTDFATAGEEILSSNWRTYGRGGPVLGVQDLRGWPPSIEAIDNTSDRWTQMVVVGRERKTQLQRAEEHHDAVFQTHTGLTVFGDLDFLEQILDWFGGAGPAALPPLHQNRLLLLLARAAQSRFAPERTNSEPPSLEGQCVPDPDWLARLLARLENNRAADLPPRVHDDVKDQISAVDALWHRFAWAKPARHLLIERLRSTKPSRYSSKAWRRQVIRHWQTDLTKLQPPMVKVRTEVAGTFSRRNPYFGVVFDLIAPAPVDNVLTREAHNVGWAEPVVLGRLSRDGSPGPLGECTDQFWLCDVHLIAVTHEGQWIDFDFLVNNLEDPHTLVPANLAGARSSINFGDPPIEALWTGSLPGHGLAEVCWWVIGWVDERHLQWQAELWRQNAGE